MLLKKPALQIPPFSKHTLDSAVAHLQFLTNRARLFNGLREKLCRKDKVLSESMATKTAGSGLTYCHLTLAWRTDKESGIEKLLGEKVCGKIRVTRCDRVISALHAHFLASAQECDYFI